PSPNELVAVIAQRGFDVGIKVVEEYRRDIPRETFVDEKAFNWVGHDFINKGLPSDAIAAFRIVVWAHPTSANSLDSLADGYIAAGDRSQARRTYERAIEVANVDPSLDAEGKKSFAADERAKFENLKH